MEMINLQEIWEMYSEWYYRHGQEREDLLKQKQDLVKSIQVRGREEGKSQAWVDATIAKAVEPIDKQIDIIEETWNKMDSSRSLLTGEVLQEYTTTGYENLKKFYGDQYEKVIAEAKEAGIRFDNPDEAFSYFEDRIRESRKDRAVNKAVEYSDTYGNKIMDWHNYAVANWRNYYRWKGALELLDPNHPEYEKLKKMEYEDRVLYSPDGTKIIQHGAQPLRMEEYYTLLWGRYEDRADVKREKRIKEAEKRARAGVQKLGGTKGGLDTGTTGTIMIEEPIPITDDEDTVGFGSG